MEATQRALVRVVREVRLRNARLQPAHTEFTLVEGTPKETALVAQLVELDDVRAGQGGFDEAHQDTVSRSSDPVAA